MSLLPQFGFFELITVAVLLLVVVGPKDLPKVMRMAGKFMNQAQSLAGDFRSAMREMAREAELDEMRAEIEALKKDNVFAETKNSIDEAMKPLEDEIRREAADVNKAVADSAASADKKADAPDAAKSVEPSSSTDTPAAKVSAE